MNFPGRASQESRFSMIPGNQLNAPRGGHVESAAIGDNKAYGYTAQRQIDRPDTIAGAIGQDEDASFEQRRIVPAAHEYRSIGKAFPPNPDDFSFECSVIQ